MFVSFKNDENGELSYLEDGYGQMIKDNINSTNNKLSYMLKIIKNNGNFDKNNHLEISNIVYYSINNNNKIRDITNNVKHINYNMKYALVYSKCIGEEDKIYETYYFDYNNSQISDIPLSTSRAIYFYSKLFYCQDNKATEYKVLSKKFKKCIK